MPLTVLGMRWERRCSTESPRVQDQQGELTTDVGEAVPGIRVVKSPGQVGRRGHVDPVGRPVRRLHRAGADSLVRPEHAGRPGR